jgi:hypothetical protein
MSRRHLTYVALVLSSLVVAACSSPTAPRRGDTTGTCKIINYESGRCEAQ